MTIMDNLEQNFCFINILMNVDEELKISQKYDEYFPQANNMYWMNQQEHMVLYFLARADNGKSVADNIVKIYNRGALFWMAEALKSTKKFKDVDIQKILNDTHEKDTNWRLRVNDIHNKLNFKENIEPFKDGAMLSKDKTELLLKYIVHYLSVLGNSTNDKDRSLILNILKNFEEGYAKHFNRVDDQTLIYLLEKSVKYIACSEQIANRVCVFKNQLLTTNLNQ